MKKKTTRRKTAGDRESKAIQEKVEAVVEEFSERLNVLSVDKVGYVYYVAFVCLAREMTFRFGWCSHKLGQILETESPQHKHAKGGGE
jgi:hypothetical protein